jgi:hypothetical protein
VFPPALLINTLHTGRKAMFVTDTPMQRSMRSFVRGEDAPIIGQKPALVVASQGLPPREARPSAG